MIKFLIAWLLFAPILCFAQTYKQQREAKKAFMKIADTCTFPKPFEFSFIDTLPMDRHSIYSKAYEWFATNTTNYNRALQMQDSSIGKLVLPEIVSTYDRNYRYTIILNVKDGKYRISFNNFYRNNDEPYQIHQIPIDTIESFKMVYFGPGTKHTYWQSEKLHLRNEAETIFASLRVFVNKKDDF